MVFSSLIFLYCYLPAVLIAYYVLPCKTRNLVLLLFSLLFYGWGEPKWIVIMLFSSVLDFTCSNLIEKHRDRPRLCRGALLTSIILNLGVLFFFKYTDFLLDSIPFLRDVPRLDITLPIGISFYTFQTMSCTIDVYRRGAKAQRNFVDFAAYVTLFPQLIAGPIVRYRDIADQLTGRKETPEKISSGIVKFCAGLCKKVLLANACGALWEQVQTRTDASAMASLLGLCCYTMQIFFDFAGYSDMAIGLGRMFGFELPVNFDYPYMSQSVSEFWRRWHITLGAWFREYVYIPLGGSRCGKLRLVRNIAVVWLLTGLWHGASWNFVLWGAFYGALLLLEKLIYGKALEKLPRALRHIYVMAAVMLGWALFAFTDTAQLLTFLRSLAGANGFTEPWAAYELRSAGLLLTAGVLCCTPLPKKLLLKLRSRAEWTQPVLCSLALIVCTANLVNASYNPFLYFRF